MEKRGAYLPGNVICYHKAIVGAALIDCFI